MAYNAPFQKVTGIPVTNKKVPYLNEIAFNYTKVTANATKVQFALKTTLTKDVEVFVKSGQGEFFSDSGATVSLGENVKYLSGSSGGQKTIYFKAYVDGVITFIGGDQFTAFGLLSGGDWAETNLLYSTGNIVVKDFDLSQLEFCPLLQKFNSPNISSFGDIAVFSGKPVTLLSIGDVNGTKKISGSLSSISNLSLTTLRVDGMTTLDVRYLPATLTNIQFAGSGNTIVNTGSNTIPAITTQVAFMNLRATNRMTSAETDTFLQALAASLATRSSIVTLTIAGTRTSASDAAITALTAKNYTVVLV